MYILINLVFALVFGFGIISRGTLKQLIISLGGLGILITTIVAAFDIGIIKGLLVALLSFIIIIPIAGFLMGAVNEKLYGKHKKDSNYFS